MNLQEIVAQKNAILQLIIESGGELSDELENALGQIDQQLEIKVDKYSGLMEWLAHDAEMFSVKAESYAKIAKSLTSVRQRIKDRIKDLMVKSGQTELLGAEVRFKLSMAQPSLVLTESLDPAYLMEVKELIPDKERIKKDLKDGKLVMGAELKTSYSLRQYINKGATK